MSIINLHFGDNLPNIIMEIQGFHRFDKAWYSHVLPKNERSILFGVYTYDEEGNSNGCVAEMSMQWVGQQPPYAPKLNCYYESFTTLLSPPFVEVMTKLAALSTVRFDEETFCYGATGVRLF